jgi:hypothetical protein
MIKIHKTTVTLPVVSCESETSLALGKDHKLQVSRNKLLRKKFLPKRDEGGGKCEVILGLN